MRNQVVITGVSGFVGAAVARRFLEAGYHVIGVVNNNPARIAGDNQHAGRLAIHRADLTDGDAVSVLCHAVAAAADSTPWGVVHVAAMTADWGPAARFQAANVDAVNNLVAQAVSHGAAFFVHTSSVAVTGSYVDHIDTPEDAPPGRLITDYQRSKAASETAVLRHSQHIGTAVLRLANVYGPGDTTTLYPIFTAMANKTMAVVDHGSRLTCPVYIDDVTEAFYQTVERLCANDRSVAGEVFTISAADRYDWRAYLDTISAITGLPRVVRDVPRRLGMLVAHAMTAAYRLVGSRQGPPVTEYRIAHVGFHHHFSIRKAQDRLGYRPAVGLEEGIARAFAAWSQT